MPSIVRAGKKPVGAQIINVQELARFLVKAKASTYARNQKEVESQRPGFKELAFKEGRWEYRDSYTGFFSAPGMEVVRFDGKPVWTMSYSGGMVKGYDDDVKFAKRTFAFLKDALSKVDPSMPFRGPMEYNFRKGKARWRYVCRSYDIVDGFRGLAGGRMACHGGLISRFTGWELIRHNDDAVFIQNFIGGLVVPKAGQILRT